jgi:tetratricopeptide (TPR) repeat protein
MKRFRLLLLITSLIPGLTACGQHKPNPEAIKLNDSAVKLMTEPPFASKRDSSLMDKVNRQVKSPDRNQRKNQSEIKLPVINEVGQYKKAQYEKAIDLLNKATQIDSNYFIAFSNKIAAQSYLKRYQDALITAKELLRLAPNNATVKYHVAGIFYKTGDTTRARAYCQEYLNYCDKKLDTMSVKNRHYKDIQLEKGLVLIFLDQQQKGREIFKTLYEKETDDSMKDMYLLYMRATKTDIVEGKELSITVGNTTTSIHL